MIKEMFCKKKVEFDSTYDERSLGQMLRETTQENTTTKLDLLRGYAKSHAKLAVGFDMRVSAIALDKSILYSGVYEDFLEYLRSDPDLNIQEVTQKLGTKKDSEEEVITIYIRW